MINLETNTGSANAFNEGLSYFLDNKVEEYVWLLDDDNLPNENTFSELVKYVTPSSAVVSLREDREKYLALTQGVVYEDAFEGNNAFVAFEIKKIRQKILKKNPEKRGYKEKIMIPHCYYGGLLVSRNILKSIDLPKKEYFLYSDDIEFTNQITKSGFDLSLISKSKLTDLEKSWFTVKRKGILNNPLLWCNDIRAYYATRNNIHFYKNHLVNNKFIFIMNGLTFLVLFSVSCIIYSKYKRLLLVFRAITDGLNERLKKRPISFNID